MCGIGVIAHLQKATVEGLKKKLAVINELQKHRGPDGNGIWFNESATTGLCHQRLSIIDIEGGSQPMDSGDGLIISFNGEIYNYQELRREIHSHNFRTNSDTEVILAAYKQWGDECVSKLRGMFSFVIWDSNRDLLFCARDRIGIKPFYYTIVDQVLYCASEAKALLPFLEEVSVNSNALKEYLHFQLYLNSDTLFEGINQLAPGHTLTLHNGNITLHRYWNVQYELDLDHTEHYFVRQLQDTLNDSIRSHLVSDVEVGAYVSGGIDSSAVATLATGIRSESMELFCGRFDLGASYDESSYARICADAISSPLSVSDIVPDDFIQNMQKVIYHLDYPVAGPGSFSQFMISEAVSKKLKVVLGGQGGDEIFGGYTRYLIAYFEQAIKGAIEGGNRNQNYIVDYDSMVPNLKYLKNYVPLMQELFKDNLFGNFAERYYQLINRSRNFTDQINWEALGDYDPFASFLNIFDAPNVNASSLFDKMSHFDFKTLLPGLLQVEDRVSMAHGLEARVPLLDHKIIEMAATVPAMIKFKGGKPKRLLIKALEKTLPDSILNREDKMGFPTPFTQWAKKETKEFIIDIFSSSTAKSRNYLNPDSVLSKCETSGEFSRDLWGMLSLEIWHQLFVDDAGRYRDMIKA